MIDKTFHKVSADGSKLNISSVADSLPPKIKEIKQNIQSYLSGMDQIWQSVTSVKEKISGKRGTDRFMVQGRDSFNVNTPNEAQNTTLIILDGDNTEVKITFTIKNARATLAPNDQEVKIS